jgi:hypothetical protein
MCILFSFSFSIFRTQWILYPWDSDKETSGNPFITF